MRKVGCIHHDPDQNMWPLDRRIGFSSHHMYLIFLLHATDVHTCCGHLALLSINLVSYLCIGYVLICYNQSFLFLADSSDHM